MLAGIVSTYFQFASQIKCMKNSITSSAFAQETAIMIVHPTAGLDMIASELPAAKEMAVSTQRAINTEMNLPVPP